MSNQAPVRVMWMRDLLAQVPISVKKTVEDTQRQYNRAIREALREELRLHLGRRDERRGDTEHESVQCIVDVGAPEEVADIEIPEELRLAAELSQHRPLLEKLSQDGTRVAEILSLHDETVGLLLRDTESGRSNVPPPAEVFAAAGWIAQRLLPSVIEFNLTGRLMAFDRDVLGLYSFARTNQIFLFWGVIGLVSNDLGVRIEDLTVVALTHELAHAYTHLGVDINSHRWDDRDFSRAQTPLVEGLAQYYTHCVMKRLRERVPGGFAVYERLLRDQPAAYRAHLPWIRDASGEALRHALIECRANSVTSYDDFTDRVMNVQLRIGRQSRRG